MAIRTGRSKVHTAIPMKRGRCLHGALCLLKKNQMKTTQLIGILFLIANLTACGQTEKNKTETLDGWKSISENDYSIDYPEDWELSKPGQMGTSFVLFSPLSSEQDQFKENVNLVIQDLTGHNLDLDKYVDLSEGQIETMITDGKIIESKRMTTETTNYQKVIYTGKQGIYNLKFEQYYWVIGDKAFVLTLTGEEDQFSNYQVIGEKIMDSFHLK
jgi:hypothetical protein